MREFAARAPPRQAPRYVASRVLEIRGFTCTQPKVILSLALLPNMVVMSPSLLAIARVVANTMRTAPRPLARSEHAVLGGELAPAVLVIKIGGHNVKYGTRNQSPGDFSLSWRR